MLVSEVEQEAHVAPPAPFLPSCEFGPPACRLGVSYSRSATRVPERAFYAQAPQLVTTRACFWWKLLDRGSAALIQRLSRVGDQWHSGESLEIRETSGEAFRGRDRR